MEPNAVKTEPLIVIGNGPSFADVPLAFLQKYPTLGQNRIYMRTDFYPDYFVYQDAWGLEHELERVIVTHYIRHVSQAWLHGKVTHLYPEPNVHPIEFHHDFSFREDFARDWTVAGFVQGKTVTYTSLQVAYWLGYRTILMVGIDHDFGSANRHFYDDSVFPEDFHYEVNEGWNDKKRPMVDAAYNTARRTFEDAGGQIVNLTPESKTDSFECQRLEDWL